jgi:UDP-N-acetylmuramoylalanine--D-glutamate ligase
MICISGSNGKTTTTSLIYELFKNAGFNVGLAGNIGKSFAWQVAENEFDYYVLELSSFQLDAMYQFKADVAVLMNITPDHLDRYEYNFQNYIDSKMRIIQNMDKNGVFIFWNDDPIIQSEIEKRNFKNSENAPILVSFSDEKILETGAFVENGQIKILHKNIEFTMLQQELALKGRHNTYNSMAAAATGLALGITKKIIRESLSRFEGVPHRLENILKIKDVLYINDSKSTNVNSAWYALESMKTPVIWIAGGVDKGNDYSMLHELVQKKVKLLICLGIDNEKLNQEFKGMTKIENVLSMEKALKAAYFYAEKGDTVLLSPACASFDLFENYEDRGNQFREGVKKL